MYAVSIGGGIGGVVVAVVLTLRKLWPQDDAEQPQQRPPAGQSVVQVAPGVDPAGDTGPHLALSMTDTQRRLIPPEVYQMQLAQETAQQVNQVATLLSHMADRSNGHGTVRREEFDRRFAGLSEKVDRNANEMRGELREVRDLVGGVGHAVAAMKATCEARSKCN